MPGKWLAKHFTHYYLGCGSRAEALENPQRKKWEGEGERERERRGGGGGEGGQYHLYQNQHFMVVQH